MILDCGKPGLPSQDVGFAKNRAIDKLSEVSAAEDAGGLDSSDVKWKVDSAPVQLGMM